MEYIRNGIITKLAECSIFLDAPDLLARLGTFLRIMHVYHTLPQAIRPHSITLSTVIKKK